MSEVVPEFVVRNRNSRHATVIPAMQIDIVVDIFLFFIMWVTSFLN